MARTLGASVLPTVLIWVRAPEAAPVSTTAAMSASTPAAATAARRMFGVVPRGARGRWVR